MVAPSRPEHNPPGSASAIALRPRWRAPLNEPRSNRPPNSTLELRKPRASELAALSELCLKSKAVWGYDAAFIAACRAELTLHPHDLADSDLVVAVLDAATLGIAQIRTTGDRADLLKLFVAPEAVRSGIGRRLFHWATSRATERGARRLVIDADPFAAPFYRHMGARDIGCSPSGSIPGRMLPQLALDLA